MYKTFINEHINYTITTVEKNTGMTKISVTGNLLLEKYRKMVAAS